MRYPCTLTAQTRQAIAAVYVDAFRALARGEPIDAAEVNRHVHDILDDAFAAERSRVINDIHPRDND